MPSSCTYCGGTQTIMLSARYGRGGNQAEAAAVPESVPYRIFPCPACGDGADLETGEIEVGVRTPLGAPDDAYRRGAIIDGLKDRLAHAIRRAITIDPRHIRQVRDGMDDEFSVRARVGVSGVPFRAPSRGRDERLRPPPPPPSAAEIKDRAAAALKPLCEIMAEAHRAGMALQFDQIAMDAFGRFNAINLRVVKVFA